jgi:hypothetical protein
MVATLLPQRQARGIRTLRPTMSELEDGADGGGGGDEDPKKSSCNGEAPQVLGTARKSCPEALLVQATRSSGRLSSKSPVFVGSFGTLTRMLSTSLPRNEVFSPRSMIA